MNRVLVLDIGYQPINEVPLRKAVRLLFRQRRDEAGRLLPVVEPVYNPKKPREEQSWIVRMSSETFLVPKVIRLVHQMRKILRNAVPLSKRNVMVRDGMTCQYCGCRDTSRLTIDHVVPSSRGGKYSWENLTTACKDCNQKKRDRTPSEAKMYLKHQPYHPTIGEHVQSRLRTMGVMDLLDEIFSAGVAER